MRINLAMAKQAISEMSEINMCITDPRLVSLINRAVERIIEESRAESLHRRIRFCIYDSCITTPAGVASLTDAAICETPIPVRNSWYEFLPDKGGVFTDSNSGQLSLHKRGEVCTIADIIGAGKKLKLYTSIAEDDVMYCYAYGGDSAGRPLRSDHTGLGVEIKDGERIPIFGDGPFTSTNEFTSLEHFEKPATRGQMLLYELNTVDSTERLLGVYEHWETLPSYQRYLIRGISLPSGCAPVTLTAMAKLEYVPVHDDRDLLLIPSMEALRMMCKAVVKLDNSDDAGGLALSQESMRRMGFHRDHTSPVESIAIGLRSRSSAQSRRNRIGRIL